MSLSTSTTVVQSLRNIDLLAGLPADVLDSLARQCAWRTFDAGQRVISRNSPPRHVYFIVAGKVRVALYSPNGREVAYRDVGADKCFGEISAIDNKPRSANVEALERSEIAIMPTGVFKALLEQHPEVLYRVALLLTATIRSLSERLFELSTLNIRNRIHAEVQRLADAAGVHDNAARIDPAPRHADIAATTATNREQVTKELSAMEKTGLIIKSGRALTVPDVARLRRIAGGGSG